VQHPLVSRLCGWDINNDAHDDRTLLQDASKCTMIQKRAFILEK